MSGGVWKAAETCTREIGVGEAERRGSKGRSREKEGGKGEEEKGEKEENSVSKESSREVGNME